MKWECCILQLGPVRSTALQYWQCMLSCTRTKEVVKISIDQRINDPHQSFVELVFCININLKHFPYPSQVRIYPEVIPFLHMEVKWAEVKRAATNLALALPSPKRQQTPKPWISCISTPANTRANPPQSATSPPTTGSGSRTEERPGTEIGNGSGRGSGKETWIGRAPRPPSASCPLTTTWDTLCSQGNTTCPMPQVSQSLLPCVTSLDSLHQPFLQNRSQTVT